MAAQMKEVGRMLGGVLIANVPRYATTAPTHIATLRVEGRAGVSEAEDPTGSGHTGCMPCAGRRASPSRVSDAAGPLADEGSGARAWGGVGRQRAALCHHLQRGPAGVSPLLHDSQA